MAFGGPPRGRGGGGGRGGFAPRGGDRGGRGGGRGGGMRGEDVFPLKRTCRQTVFCLAD